MILSVRIFILTLFMIGMKWSPLWTISYCFQFLNQHYGQKIQQAIYKDIPKIQMISD